MVAALARGAAPATAASTRGSSRRRHGSPARRRYRPATNARCRAAFVRFPQIRIEHHWLDRLRERS